MQSCFFYHHETFLPLPHSKIAKQHNMEIYLTPPPPISLFGRLQIFLARAGIMSQSQKMLLEQRYHALLLQYDPLISKICFSYAESRADMEDLHQDVLINLWQGLPGFRGESSEKTWIYRVALNTCVATLRKKKLKHTLPWNNDLMDVVDESHQGRQAAAELRESIDQLSPRDRAVILMWLEDMTYDEMATVIGISRNTLATRLRRAKEKLKKEL